MNFDDPKVFGDGALTLCVGTRGCNVFIGTKQVGFISSISFNMNMETGIPEVAIQFPNSHDKEIQLRIEEEIRTIKQIPWIQVQR